MNQIYINFKVDLQGRGTVSHSSAKTLICGNSFRICKFSYENISSTETHCQPPKVTPFATYHLQHIFYDLSAVVDLTWIYLFAITR